MTFSEWLAAYPDGDLTEPARYVLETVYPPDEAAEFSRGFRHGYNRQFQDQRPLFVQPYSRGYWEGSHMRDGVDQGLPPQ